MPSNDRLFLILHPRPDGAHAVQWRRVDALVRAIEEGMTTAVVYLAGRRNILTDHVEVTAALDGSVQVRSIWLPLALDVINLAPILAEPLMTADSERPEVLAILEGLADAASVVEFCRNWLFSERGVIAKLLGQVPSEGEPEPFEALAQTSSPEFLQQLEIAAVGIMRAAEQTGCQSVEVQINGQTAIRLTRDAPRRSPFALAPQGDRREPLAEDLVFKRMRPSVPVRVEGGPGTAFPAAVDDPTGLRTDRFAVVLVRRQGTSVPDVGGKFRIKGRFVNREDVEVLDDLPESWPDTKGVFLVDKLKPEHEWD